MSLTHPYQKSFCALFISLALIVYFTNLKKQRLQEIQENITLTGNTNLSINDDILEGFWELKNISRKEIFHTLKFVNLSYGLEKENLERIRQAKNVEQIYILGLFEFTTKLGRRNDGESELMAAKMAVKHVNALNVLPGYELVLLVNDTQCDPGVAIDRFFHAIYSEHNIVMVLGSGCSNVTEALAHIVPYWNIIQVSYGSKSPTLSDRRKFPLFFRTVAPVSSHNIAKVHFIKHFGWHVIATFSQSENEYLLPINHLIPELEKQNISCISTITFSTENFKEQLKILKSLDIRIIIGSFSEQIAPLIFCAAYNFNMVGNEYVWILEQHETYWWQHSLTECKFKEIMTAVNGIFMVSDYKDGYYNDAILKVMWGSNNQNPLFLNGSLQISNYVRETYDAIWAIGLTLRISSFDLIKRFHYQNNDAICNFYNTMKNMEFVGLSGPIKFNGADRVGDILISQIQERQLKRIALYDSIRDTLDFKCRICENNYWKNGHVPIAQRILKDILVTIPRGLCYAIGCLSFVGVACSVALLYFNLKFRRMITVKLSSPNLNNLTVIGCILVYLSVILFGLHNVSLDIKAYYNKLCSLKIYLLSTGFSLTFGSMLAKSYRVHRIFACTTPSLVRNKLLKDRQLIGVILIPIFVDTLIVGLWMTIDPLERHLHNLALENSKNDFGVVYQPQVEICLCRNTVGWHIALFGYKSLILTMGVYMAWKTRHVKVAALNESQYIGICVYSAVFATIIVIIFSFVTEYLILSYLAKTLSILASTSITLVLMFLPKFKSIYGQIDTELSIMQSMGLKLQSNTRRFILEDPKELMHRLEIQNKVYRCEIGALDKEILRLEDLLKKPVCHSSVSAVQVCPSDVYFLNIPRASWPTWQNQTLKQFSSENKLNIAKHFEKTSLLGKLKSIFGSFNSLQYTYNNLEVRAKDKRYGECEKVIPLSNPEISRQIAPFGADLGKIKSESCIGNSY